MTRLDRIAKLKGSIKLKVLNDLRPFPNSKAKVRAFSTTTGIGTCDYCHRENKQVHNLVVVSVPMRMCFTCMDAENIRAVDITKGSARNQTKPRVTGKTVEVNDDGV